MSQEQTAEMWKEFRRQQAIHKKGAANKTAEAFAEWNKQAEELEVFKKRIEALEDQ